MIHDTFLEEYALKNNLFYFDPCDSQFRTAGNLHNLAYLTPLIKYGYKPDLDSIKLFLCEDDETAKRIGEKYATAIADILGLKIQWNVLWDSFEKVKNKSKLELWITAIYHYLTCDVLVDFTTQVGIQEWDRLNSQNNFKLLKFVNYKGLADFVEEKITKLSSVNNADLTIADYFVKNYWHDSIADSDFYSREVATYVAAKNNFYHTNLVQSGLDILRCAAWYSGFNPVELGKKKFINISRPIRKAILDKLDYLIQNNMIGNIRGYENEFKRLAEKIKPKDYPQFEFANSFFDKIYKGEYQHLPHIDNRKLSIEKRLKFASAGDVLRRAISLVRDDEKITLNKKFWDKLFDASIEQLLQLWSQTKTSKQDEKIAIIPKGDEVVFKVYTPKNTKNQEFVNEYFADAIESLIKWKFENKFQENKMVYFNPELENVALPFGERSNNASVGLPKGSFIELNSNDKLNFGIHWFNASGYRVDLDLSVLVFDENFNYQNEISWRNLRNLTQGEIIHSGDITNGENGAAEFIQVSGFSGYLVPVVNSYTGQAFNTFENKFTCFFANEKLTKGYYNPNTVKLFTNLTGEYKFALPMVFDMINYRGIVTNLYTKNVSNVAASSRNILKTTIKSIVQRKFVTCGDLVRLCNFELTDEKSATLKLNSWQDMIQFL